MPRPPETMIAASVRLTVPASSSKPSTLVAIWSSLSAGATVRHFGCRARVRLGGFEGARAQRDELRRAGDRLRPRSGLCRSRPCARRCSIPLSPTLSLSTSASSGLSVSAAEAASSSRPRLVAAATTAFGCCSCTSLLSSAAYGSSRKSLSVASSQTMRLVRAVLRGFAGDRLRVRRRTPARSAARRTVSASIRPAASASQLAGIALP